MRAHTHTHTLTDQPYAHTRTDLLSRGLALHEMADLAQNALLELDPGDGSVLPDQEWWPKSENPRTSGYFSRGKPNTCDLCSNMAPLHWLRAHSTPGITQNCPSEDLAARGDTEVETEAEETLQGRQMLPVLSGWETLSPQKSAEQESAAARGKQGRDRARGNWPPALLLCASGYPHPWGRFHAPR